MNIECIGMSVAHKATALTKITAHRLMAMSAIKSKNTQPERLVRSAITELGYRFRLHPKHLSGRPDIALTRLRKVIFVHGCFWHQHSASSCRLVKKPKANLGYWLPKFERNRRRDARNIRELKAVGWRVLIVWECQLKDRAKLKRRLKEFLESKP